MKYLTSILLFSLVLSLSTNTIFAKNISKKQIPNSNQTKTIKPKNNSIPQNIAFLLSQARTSAPEFYTDALIRIVESKKIKDTKINIQLLEEAFEEANHVQFKLKKTIFKSINTDTRTALLDGAYETNLDKISLQCRIISILLDIDKNAAKKLFSKISFANDIKEPLSCQDSAVYDVTIYYKTAQKIAVQCFTPKQIENRYRLNFVQDLIKNIVSASELNHAAILIKEFNWKPLELEILLSSYIDKLAHLDNDYRTFIASEYRFRNIQSIHELASFCEKKQVSSKYLVQDYRLYILRHLSRVVCTTSYTKQELSNIISRANNRLFSNEPIALEELKLQEELFREEQVFFSSDKSKSVFTDAHKFLLAREKAIFDADYDKTKIEEMYSKLLENIRSWKATDEPTEEDYLHQKSLIYKELINIHQIEEQKEELLFEYLLFLRDFNLEKINRVEWFIHLKFVLEMIKVPENRAKIIKLLDRSQISVADLYKSLIVENL